MVFFINACIMFFLTRGTYLIHAKANMDQEHQWDSRPVIEFSENYPKRTDFGVHPACLPSFGRDPYMILDVFLAIKPLADQSFLQSLGRYPLPSTIAGLPQNFAD